MAILQAIDITKTFESKPVLIHVGLMLEESNILCLLGPSGCGKTTLLRIIAGLERPDTGKIIFNGQDMAGIEPHRRAFGMMFQEYALFPHKDVFGNVSFGLRMQRLPGTQIVQRTRDMLDLVGLSGYEHRGVSELSGGERQRVALARTLAPRPRLLLLDEPLGALDRALRERLMAELKSILNKIGMTTVFVTHDQAEAYAVADVIAVIIEGRIVQIDKPERLYRQPAGESVARFLGLHNIIEGKVGESGDILSDLGTINLKIAGYHKGDHVALLLQPDSARLAGPADKEDENPLLVSCVVKNYLFRGKSYTLEAMLPSGRVLVFDLPENVGSLKINQEIRLSIDPSGFSVMNNS